jgi:hypothetical protein
LAASKEGYADKAAHFEFLSAVGELHLGAVSLAVLGIEYFSALILVSLLCKTPKDRHAKHRLIAPSAIALVAFGRRIVPRLGENLLDSAFELAIYFSNSHQPLRLAGVVVDGFPKANG